MTTSLIIDAPGPYNSVDDWQAFLAEMQATQKTVFSIDDAMLVDRMIARAELILKDRAGTKARSADWDESEHPRDEDGKFTFGGGGSDGSVSDGGSGGPASTSAGFVSPNVKTNLNFEGAVKELNSKQQEVLHEASAHIDRELGIKGARETSIVGAWSDGAENSVMMEANSDWDRTVLATVMKGYLADQKSVLVFQQQEGGHAVLAHFDAKGDLATIHENLLKDGLEFHTIVPTPTGATVYIVDLDGSAADAIKRGASRYGEDNKISIQFGRGEFIPSFEQQVEGSDREQRISARSVYEQVIDRSPVQGAAEVWKGVRDRWGQALTFLPPAGKTWQGIAENAAKKWHADNPKIAAKTIALNKDIDQAMAEAHAFKDYRDWYARHKPLATKLFGKNEPYFEKFLAATSVNSAGKPNVAEALRATIHFVNGGTFDKKHYTGVMGSTRNELLRVQHGQPLTGQKVVPFAQVLAGDWDHAPTDRHMKNLLFKNPNLTGGNRAQAAVTDAVVRAISKELGWKAAELQAVLWVVDKSREANNQTAIIFDYQQYIKQEAPRVRALLAAHKTLRSREAYAGAKSLALDEDEVAASLEAEADAWRNADLLLDYFQEIQDAVGDDLTPDAVIAALGMAKAYTAAQRLAINARAKQLIAKD